MSKMRRIGYGLVATLCLVLQGCTGVPEGIDPVTDFDQGRYLGTWYEIARLDHSFERGLSDVTATYSINPDGSIAVLNRGFDQEEARWREAEGVARFVDSPTVAHLKVSFFGPFYCSSLEMTNGAEAAPSYFEETPPAVGPSSCPLKASPNMSCVIVGAMCT